MHHPSGGHQFLGQASARLDHPQGVLQREGPGDTGGANFTETVTEQRAGSTPQAIHKRASAYSTAKIAGCA